MTVTLHTEAKQLDFVWLEVTSRCPLRCLHCYADSGPDGDDGVMEKADWIRVIGQVAEAGARWVQFIGGEPLIYRPLPELVKYALKLGLQVEIFSSLVVLPDRHHPMLTQPNVRVATSYYSGKADEHDRITTVPGSHKRTKRNIDKLVNEWGVPVRTGVIHQPGNQDIAGAYRELEDLGVDPNRIGYDRVRQVGRGISDQEASLDQLCGNCGMGNAAVLPNGDVVPCTLSRWMEPVGNVLEQSLEEVLTSPASNAKRAELQKFFAERRSSPDDSCNPNCMPICWPELRDNAHGDCTPDACRPQVCVPDAVCKPTECVPTDKLTIA